MRAYKRMSKNGPLSGWFEISSTAEENIEVTL